MPKQNINTDTRFALWKAHNCFCNYCGQPLAFGEVDIDHIVPETLASDSKAFQQTVEVLGLPADFNIRSLNNLIPAHRRCNRAKSTRVFAPTAVALFLKIASDAETKVQSFISARRKQNSRDVALANLSEALQNGLIMPIDLLEHSQHPESVTLTKPLVFADGVEQSVSPEQVETFLNRPVLMGGDPEFFAGFGNDVEEKMQVRTCREYRAALAAGYYARTTYDMKSEAFLKAVNAVLGAVEAVRVPTVSFINKPFRGVADLDLMPVTILPVISPDDEEAIKQMSGLSLGDLIGKGELKILKTSSNEVSMEWRWGLMLRELCRADLDGDGIEDILCEWYCWAVGGTMGFGSVMVLSRRGPDEQYTIKQV